MTSNNIDNTTVIDKINLPQDIKGLNIEELKILAEELRKTTIDTVSKTGGHLGAGLGVIEMTIALHYVFNTPDDKIIWDVGHQSYPHKILTGRKDKITSIRQPSGLSGFTKRSESEFDVFGAGHSSTSISAALGIDIANQINNKKDYVIAVIGDGAISAGMAYEAMNNAGYKVKNHDETASKLIVILNDNDMSIAKPTGAMSNYLSRLTSSQTYFKFRDISKKFTDKLTGKIPQIITNFPRKFEKSVKEWWMGGNIFEELGFYYIGPIDGHNLELLISILENSKNNSSNRPILIHCITEKGKGFNEKMPSQDNLHAVSKFDANTGIQDIKPTNETSYSKIFGNKLCQLAESDQSIIAITAAMPSGTGLDIFAKKYQKQFFDVGIAEQHAVTFAAGLATENLKPFVAIYSTFLQRGYDQIVHDVAIQNLAVRFIIDRAGFVGADGPTHCGAFDISYLINLPNFIIMAPADGLELVKMINTANQINNNPCSIRFPRGSSKINIDYYDNEALEIGKGRIFKEINSINKNNEIKLLFISLGTIIDNVIEASEILCKKHNDISIKIIDARFDKPIDKKLIIDETNNSNIVITIEEGVIGGFGSAVSNLLSEEGIFDNKKIKFRSLFMKDKFIDQNNIDAMQEEAGIGINAIISKVESLL